MIPTLRTDRLVLRAHRLADFDAYCALWGDPAVTRYIGGKPFDRETCWSRFLRQTGMWIHMGFGYFVVEEGGRFVGEAGFQEARRSIDPHLEGTLEAGWALMPDAHGRGLAIEAMTACIRWAEANLGSMEMTCIIDPANTASIRTACRLGFVEAGTARYREQPTGLYRRQARPGLSGHGSGT